MNVSVINNFLHGDDNMSSKCESFCKDYKPVILKAEKMQVVFTCQFCQEGFCLKPINLVVFTTDNSARKYAKIDSMSVKDVQ